MALKEYEVNGPSGKYTIQLSEDDAKERGLKGGKEVGDAEEFSSATGAPGTPEPVAAPETPVLADEDVSAKVVKTQTTPKNK